jgi:hypothetical protein
MGLPMRQVVLPREAVYSLLAFLKRHKAQKSPRALRFEMLPGQPLSLVLEPWEQRIQVHGSIWPGRAIEPIRIWGRQRLLCLARLLPLAERMEVCLLGAGLPSFWVVRMGEMALTLGLSGWTTNDWTCGSALDLLAPPAEPSAQLIAKVAQYLHSNRRAAFADIDLQAAANPAQTAAALRYLAHTGQVIYDLPNQVYRWRQIMPQALGEAEMGPENPEQVASRQILARKQAKIESRTDAPNGGKIFTGIAESKPVELLVDSDGRIKRGKCMCSHHFKAGLRMGPCRHLLALRGLAWQEQQAGVAPSAQNWYEQLQQWAAS